MNHELPHVQASFRKAEESETSVGSSKKQESPRKMSFCLIDYATVCDYVDHNKLWKILQDMRIPDHVT